jgi:hypothetical protein
MFVRLLQAGVLCVPLLRLSLLQLEMIGQVVSNEALMESNAASSEQPLPYTSEIAIKRTKRAKKRVGVPQKSKSLFALYPSMPAIYMGPFLTIDTIPPCHG